MNSLLRLSDEAFNNLIEQAHSHNYIRVKRWVYGLGEFIDKLSTLQYKDTRPLYLKEWNPSGHSIWCIPEYAAQSAPHLISLDELTPLQFVNIALQFDILRVTLRNNNSETQPYIVHFKTRQTPTMITSAVLEAIGTKLLTPASYIPDKTWSSIYPRKSNIELLW